MSSFLTAGALGHTLENSHMWRWGQRPAMQCVGSCVGQQFPVPLSGAVSRRGGPVEQSWASLQPALHRWTSTKTSISSTLHVFVARGLGTLQV